MRARSSQVLRTGLRDMLIGGLAFLLVSFALTWQNHPSKSWSISEAAAGEIIASRAVEVTAPAGAKTENAVVAAAQLRPAADPLLMWKVLEMVIMGMTFSLLFAFNMGLVRHLRRVDATSRPRTS
ncbi:MAG: hypothetical protein ACK5JT_13355 [Hyphomicrobiaceae bacterium]